jgi:L-lactate dehydrogenase (cytochrome)
MVIKGILDPEDARDAKIFGADGIVVSNHGGRQLDGALSTARALPTIADELKGSMTIFADGGIRTGLDVLRMLALGADGVLIGRAFVYAMAAKGKVGIRELFSLLEKELRTSMVLTGATNIKDINYSMLSNKDISI